MEQPSPKIVTQVNPLRHPPQRPEVPLVHVKVLIDGRGSCIILKLPGVAWSSWRDPNPDSARAAFRLGGMGRLSKVKAQHLVTASTLTYQKKVVDY